MDLKPYSYSSQKLHEYKCNSKKGSKKFDKFINQYDKIYFDKDELIELLTKYQVKFAKEIDLNIKKKKTPDEYKAFLEVKQEIFNLME